jgi:L-cysteine S-thiosulfotransferase
MPQARARSAGRVRPSGLTLVFRFLPALTITLAAQAQQLPGTEQGDPTRGRQIVADRQQGLCLLCHTAPIPEERFQGNLAPDLSGAGDRHTPDQLRQRIIDSRASNPSTIMPSYFKTDGLARVAPAQRGKTILTAQQVEDVVAYLATLRSQPGK